MNRDQLVLGTVSLLKASASERPRILDRFGEWGGRWIDTAPLYEGGAVEHWIGRLMAETRHEFKLSTKLGHFRCASHFRSDRHLAAALCGSVERLGRWPDQVLLHEADWPVWWGGGQSACRCDPSTSAPAWKMLRSCASRQNARVGISGNSAATLREIAALLQPDIVLVAKQFDLIWRAATPFIADENAHHDLWLGAPYHQGWLFRLKELARQSGPLGVAAASAASVLPTDGTAVAKIALAWVKRAAPQARIVVGVGSLAELEVALEAWETPLPPAINSDLARLSFLGPAMPGPYALPIEHPEATHTDDDR